MDTRQRTRFSIAAVALLSLAAAVSLLIVFVLHVREATLEQLRKDQARRRQEWIDEQLSALKSGEQSNVYFYCTADTDELLEHFRGMEEVQDLGFELTNVSQEGLRIIREFPNLRKLMLYGGQPNVDDAGLRELEGHPALRELVLVNTNVTDAGLDVLTTFPNLRRLTLFREGYRGTTLTDRAVETLRTLQQLEKLELSGGWISEKAVEELRKALPDCEIVTAGDWE